MCCKKAPTCARFRGLTLRQLSAEVLFTLLDGLLDALHTAFSRERAEKVYVQHLIRAADNAEALVADLDQGAYVFVCGATNMGPDVMAAVVDVLVEHKGLSKEAAADAVKDLQKQGRYVQELWTP
jgi:sulfite reductase (NADPH) flavoprotein alpha-component